MATTTTADNCCAVRGSQRLKGSGIAKSPLMETTNMARRGDAGVGAAVLLVMAGVAVRRRRKKRSVLNPEIFQVQSKKARTKTKKEQRSFGWAQEMGGERKWERRLASLGERFQTQIAGRRW